MKKKKSICELHRKTTCKKCETDGTWTFEGLEDCADMMWGLICNVSEGDLTKQNKEWQTAFKRIRKYYFSLSHLQEQITLTSNK